MRNCRFNSGKLLASDKRNAVGYTNACKYIAVEVIVGNCYCNSAFYKSVNNAYVAVKTQFPWFNPPRIYAGFHIHKLIKTLCFKLHITRKRHSFKAYFCVEITRQHADCFKACKQENRYRRQLIKFAAYRIGKPVYSAAQTCHKQYRRRKRDFQSVTYIKFDFIGNYNVLILYVNLLECQNTLTFNNLDV